MGATVTASSNQRQPGSRCSDTTVCNWLYTINWLRPLPGPTTWQQREYTPRPNTDWSSPRRITSIWQVSTLFSYKQAHQRPLFVYPSISGSRYIDYYLRRKSSRIFSLLRDNYPLLVHIRSYKALLYLYLLLPSMLRPPNQTVCSLRVALTNRITSHSIFYTNSRLCACTPVIQGRI